MSSVLARKLTWEGEKAFREYIEKIRHQPDSLPDPPDLDKRPFSTELKDAIQIPALDSSNRPETKYDLACLIHEVLESVNNGTNKKTKFLAPEYRDFWSWLAYKWLDILMLRDRKVGESARYICSTDYQDYYRHLVAGPYIAYLVHGESSRILLYSPPHKHSDFMEQIGSRQFIFSNPELVKAIYKLYFDPLEGKPRKGASDRDKPGNLRRFITVIQQLELTYDIHSMNAERILELLPREFDEWKEKK